MDLAEKGQVFRHGEVESKSDKISKVSNFKQFQTGRFVHPEDWRFLAFRFHSTRVFPR